MTVSANYGKPTMGLRRGTTLLSLALLPILLGACHTCQPQALLVDPSLIHPLSFPPRPASPTNGDLIEVMAETRSAIEVDNTRKEELREQLRRSASP